MLLLPAAVWAQTIPTPGDLPTGRRPNSWHIFNGMAAGLNGPVLGDVLKVYRKMPWGVGDTLLNCDSHWRAGGQLMTTPAFIRPSVMAGFSPWLFMDLDVHYGTVINFTEVNFDSYNDSYDAQKPGEPDRYFTLQQQAQANLTLKMAAGPIAVLHFTDLDWWLSDDYYFNWEFATVVRDGFSLRNRTFLLYEFMKNWRIFINYENNNYFESYYMNELVSSGFVIMHPPWNNFLWLFQLGYHVHNPDFEGLKVWSAFVMEWDFPDAE